MAVGRRHPREISKFPQWPWERASRWVYEHLQDIVDALGGLPTPHATTHQGGDDDIAGTSAPHEIDFDLEADPGDATLGFAPIGHIHPLSEEMEALQGLAGTSVETLNGLDVTYVYDPEGLKLLTAIYYELHALAEGR